jgi:ankyrin repeat protein
MAMARRSRRALTLWIATATLALLVAAPASLLAQTPPGPREPSPRDLRVYAGLHAAAANGDVAAIEQLIADGEKPNIQDANSRTPLLVAAFRRQLAAAQALLRLGANPNAHDADGYDMLAVATSNNDIEMLKAALAAGANARATAGYDNGSALILAARLGYADIVRALIEANADIDRVNTRGWTALISAVTLGNGDKAHIAVVEALVAAHANGDIKDQLGRTALDYARARGYTDMVPILEKSVGRHT